MTAAAFQPVAESLRQAVLEWYEERGTRLSGPGDMNTLDTNSRLVARRTAPLLEMLRRRGVASVAGLEVVDLGCGFGAMSAYLAASGARVTGVDPHEERLEVGTRVAERHGLPVRLLQGWMQDLPGLPSESFDVAIQNNSLCYIVDREDRRRALSETLRILKPGGWLVARNPNRWHPVDQFTRLPLVPLLPPEAADRAARLWGRRRSRVRLASPLEGRRELRTAGFVDVQQAGFVDSSRPDVLRFVARYQHFTARRESTFER